MCSMLVRLQDKGCRRAQAAKTVLMAVQALCYQLEVSNQLGLCLENQLKTEGLEG